MAGRMSVKNAKPAARGPYRELVYGVEGVGKSTFGAGAPAPIFLGAEEGTRHLGVDVFPKPESFGDVLDAVISLGVDEHRFKTLVLDTADWIEPLVFAAVCAAERKKSIEDVGGGYGKGYTKALDLWRELLRRLSELQGARGMNVIILAHAQVKKSTAPTGESFDRYTLKLNEKAGALLKEWAESVLFANYAVAVVEDKSKRKFGTSSGARLLHTTWSAAYDAKNRHGLPDWIPLSFAEFDEACRAGMKDRITPIVREFERGLLQLRDEIKRANAKKAFDEAREKNDEGRLRDLANRLRVRLEEQEQLREEASTEQAAAAPSPSTPPSSAARVDAPPRAQEREPGAAKSANPGEERAPAGAVAPPPAVPLETAKPGELAKAMGVTAENAPSSLAPDPEPKKEATPAKDAGFRDPLLRPGAEEGAQGVREGAPRGPGAGLAAAAPINASRPVTVEELLEWIGDANVAHAEAAVKLLGEKSIEASELPCQIARLVKGGPRSMRWEEIERLWKGAGGTFKTSYTTKGKPFQDFAPMNADGFRRFWFAEIRGVESVSSPSPVEVLGSGPEGF